MADEQIIRPKEPERTPEEERLVELYQKMGMPLDRLPYTTEFDELFNEFTKQFPRPHNNEGRREVLQRLLNMRKAGKLPPLRTIRQETTIKWPRVG